MKPFKEEFFDEYVEIKPFKIEALDEENVKIIKKSNNFLGSLRSVFIAFFALLFVWILANLIKSIENIFKNALLHEYIYLLGFTFLFTLLFLFTWDNLRQIKYIKSVENIRNDLKKQRKKADKNILYIADFLINSCGKSADKDILKNVQEEIQSSGIYENIYESLDKKLLKSIDEKAKKLITKASLQAAFCTAISPIAFIDMALILYRSVSLTKEIASLYGFKPTIASTYILLKKGFINVMFAGVVELAGDFTNQAASTSFLSKASTQLGQGVANGILLARLGFGVLEACRPMDFEEGRSNFFKLFLSSLKDAIKTEKG